MFCGGCLSTFLVLTFLLCGGRLFTLGSLGSEPFPFFLCSYPLTLGLLGTFRLSGGYLFTLGFHLPTSVKHFIGEGLDILGIVAFTQVPGLQEGQVLEIVR